MMIQSKILRRSIATILILIFCLTFRHDFGVTLAHFLFARAWRAWSALQLACRCEVCRSIVMVAKENYNKRSPAYLPLPDPLPHAYQRVKAAAASSSLSSQKRSLGIWRNWHQSAECDHVSTFFSLHASHGVKWTDDHQQENCFLLHFSKTPSIPHWDPLLKMMNPSCYQQLIPLHPMNRNMSDSSPVLSFETQ